MRYIFALLILFTVITSCKSDKSEATSKKQKELTVAKKIADAHGFKHWENVTKIQFTFRVDRDSIKGRSRTWRWFPKKDSINMGTGLRRFRYNRQNIDSLNLGADRAFINDKYWLLVPFQLVWDSTATISEPKMSKAPISKLDMNMITILYPNEGGYTPGDAYDIYYDENYMIKEWTFRKGNAELPSLSTTFENYNDYKGIKIATDHKREDENWNLKLTKISIETEN